MIRACISQGGNAIRINPNGSLGCVSVKGGNAIGRNPNG